MNRFIRATILGNSECLGYRPDVKILSFWDLVAAGKRSSNNNEEAATEPVPPTPDSTCIIMYTSGLHFHSSYQLKQIKKL